MATSQFIYLAPNLLDPLECRVCLIPSQIPDGTSVAELGEPFLTQMIRGILRSTGKTDGRQFRAEWLNDDFYKISEDLVHSHAGATLPVEQDINGNYYVADADRPLFERWTGLTDDQKVDMSLRILHQMDPFRQGLLDTLIGLPDDEILAVIDFGLNQYNPYLMAIAIQALPDPLLNNVDITSQILADLKEVIAQPHAMTPLHRTAITEFPLFYAMEKLSSGRSDCYSQAWLLAKEHYSKHLFNNDAFDNMLIPHVDHSHEGVTGFLISEAEGLVAKKDTNGAVQAIFRAANGERGGTLNGKAYISSYSVDSMLKGYAKPAELVDIDHIDIAIDLAGEDRTLDGLAEYLISGSREEFIHPEDILQAFSKIGADKSISVLERCIEKANICTPKTLGNLIWDARHKLKAYPEVRAALCGLHVRQNHNMSNGYIGYSASYWFSDDVAIQQYTSKEAVVGSFNLAFDFLRDIESIIGDDLPTKINSVMHYTSKKNEWPITAKAHHTCHFAKTCLALSGLQHEDIIASLDSKSLDLIVAKMNDVEIPIDTRAMIKLNPLCKSKMLEIELGL